MEQCLIRAIRRDDQVWINAGDMLAAFDSTIAEYRRQASQFDEDSIIHLKCTAFADAVQAERDDLATTIEEG